MNRASVLLCILATSGFQPAFGQQQAQPEDALPLVYEAFYAIDYGSVTDWTEQFRAYSVPVLKVLQEEGLIRSWSYWRHQTGGDGYNSASPCCPMTGPPSIRSGASTCPASARQ